VRLVVVNARDPYELRRSFAALIREGAGALLVSGDALFVNHTDQLATLAARYGMPVM
jgi:hypothetical protein